MSTGNYIQIIGIIVSAVIGILSLCIGVHNKKEIKRIRISLNPETREKIVVKQKTKNKRSSSIQVGGDISQWKK